MSEQSPQQVQETLRWALDQNLKYYVSSRNDFIAAERELSEYIPRVTELGKAAHDRMLMSNEASASVLKIMGDYVTLLETELTKARTLAADRHTRIVQLEEAAGGHHTQTERHQARIEELKTKLDLAQREALMAADKLSKNERDLELLRQEPAALRSRIQQLEVAIANRVLNEGGQS